MPLLLSFLVLLPLLPPRPLLESIKYPLAWVLVFALSFATNFTFVSNYDSSFASPFASTCGLNFTSPSTSTWNFYPTSTFGSSSSFAKLFIFSFITCALFLIKLTPNFPFEIHNNISKLIKCWMHKTLQNWNHLGCLVHQHLICNTTMHLINHQAVTIVVFIGSV